MRSQEEATMPSLPTTNTPSAANALPTMDMVLSTSVFSATSPFSTSCLMPLSSKPSTVTEPIRLPLRVVAISSSPLRCASVCSRAWRCWDCISISSQKTLSAITRAVPVISAQAASVFCAKKAGSRATARQPVMTFRLWAFAAKSSSLSANSSAMARNWSFAAKNASTISGSKCWPRPSVMMDTAFSWGIPSL